MTDNTIVNTRPAIDRAVDQLITNDPLLSPYRADLTRRLQKIEQTTCRLTQNRMSLADFASGHEYFGLHFRNGHWIFREWAPNATAIYLMGDMTGWKERASFALIPGDPSGAWQLRLPADAMNHGDMYRLSIHWPGGRGDRIPAWARRVVQDPDTMIFNAQVWRPTQTYTWRHADFKRRREPLLIYEAHVGMAQQEAKLGTYIEFRERILPRIVDAGYNTLQLMAIPEHPYYGSFGYHVSSFFAASSRFGTPHDLKSLIDQAHDAGLAVIIDLVHSHAVSNQVEGLSHFDGTAYQYFHNGPRGHHTAWDSRCFDYGKFQVLHFLLSNCRFWLDEFKVDGFRFDGITSMLYAHHGLNKAFAGYADYFDDSVDEDALTYLTLANRLIHDIRPDAVTIAEDISGIPGLALPVAAGGCGFDYRFAMGTPDYWIKLIKERKDEDWPVGGIWYELTNRRRMEKTISYAESHDQALVGDQTLIFRLMQSAMYNHMQRQDAHLGIDRGMALHKIIRLITLATAGNGYLNFMGNEFGHPEWIDFPREGNNWSYRHARRQWNLVDDANLKYRFLANFDKAMILLARKYDLLNEADLQKVYDHEADQILAFTRAGLLFIFNFNPTQSFTDYRIPARSGQYRMILDTDAARFGGHDRLTPDQRHNTWPDPFQPDHPQVRLYLPNRCAMALCGPLLSGGQTYNRP